MENKTDIYTIPYLNNKEDNLIIKYEEVFFDLLCNCKNGVNSFIYYMNYVYNYILNLRYFVQLDHINNKIFINHISIDKISKYDLKIHLLELYFFEAFVYGKKIIAFNNLCSYNLNCKDKKYLYRIIDIMNFKIKE